MGILASIFAYLSALAAIIAFFLMSADALLYHAHHQAANPPPEPIAAAKINPDKPNKAAHQPQWTADAGAIAKTGAAAEYRRKADLSNARFEEQHRRAWRREHEARYRALRRERAAAPLALGYAQEPAPRFGDEPWR